MKKHRLERVAEAVREVASETILFQLRDPRVKGVTVTRTEVSGDLQHAKVFVSVMGTPAQQKTALHGLRAATGFVQSRLADRLQLRFTPALTFVEDTGVKNSIKIAELLRAEAERSTADSVEPGGHDVPSEAPVDAADGSADGAK